MFASTEHRMAVFVTFSENDLQTFFFLSGKLFLPGAAWAQAGLSIDSVLSVCQSIDVNLWSVGLSVNVY